MLGSSGLVRVEQERQTLYPLERSESSIRTRQPRTVNSMSSEGKNAVRESEAQNDVFEEVFERYYRPISYYFSRRGFSADESRELTQETFLRAYKGWEQFRPEQERGWIFTIAANIYRNVVRNRHTQKRDAQVQPLALLIEAGQEPPSAEADPETQLRHKQRQNLVLEALLELPPRMRQCFHLRFSHELKYEEIAHVMQTSIQSVKSQLHQAKLRIRRQVSEHE